MKYLLVLFTLIPAFSFAAIVTECGEYTVKGVVRGGIGISIIVNEKTMSQYTLSMPGPQQAQIGAYLDAPVTAKVVMTEHLSPVKGKVTEIVSISKRIPNPLNPEDTGLILNKKLECRKN